MANRVHSVSKLLRMTSEEAKLLKENALGANMGESAYLRLMISQKPNDYPEIRRLLKDLINEVNRIGVNINQIAFNNNAGFYSENEKNRLFAYMRKLNRIVDEAVKVIGNH